MTKSEIFEQITNSPEYQVLKDYHQHGSHSVYNHSVNVYNACFKIAKKLHIKVNEESLAKSALLHDYFLYDWHDDKNPVSHFTRHPARGYSFTYVPSGAASADEQGGADSYFCG